MIAVVLSGGGAKGAFQAGVLCALHDEGIHPELVVGTSVGALNAAGLSHLGLLGMVSTWRGIKGIKDVFRDRWWKLPFNGSGRYSMAPLRKTVERISAQPRHPGGPEAVACYVDLKTTAVHHVSNATATPAEFATAVLASASIPFYMEPVDGYLVDGGVREVAPVRYALERMGWQGHLIVITCQPLDKDRAADPFDESWPRALSMGLRALDVRDHETLLNDLSAAVRECGGTDDHGSLKVTVYSPTEYLYSTFDFRPAQLAWALEEGWDVGKAGGTRWA